jgi:hypothetical protein
MKNIHQEPSKHKSQSKQVFMQSKVGFIRSYARIHNLAFIHFSYQRITRFCQNRFRFKIETLGLKPLETYY